MVDVNRGDGVRVGVQRVRRRVVHDHPDTTGFGDRRRFVDPVVGSPRAQDNVSGDDSRIKATDGTQSITCICRIDQSAGNFRPVQ